MDKTERKLTTGQVAHLLGLSTERIRQFAREGRLASEDTPYGRLFDAEEVERFAAERRYVAGQEQGA